MNITLAANHTHKSLDSGVGTMTADQQRFFQATSIDYSGGSSSADETNSCVVENSMWDEWTQHHSAGPGPGDEVSTSNVVFLGLPELTAVTSSATSSRHYSSSFPSQADTLSSWMSTFQPQLSEDQLSLDPELFLHNEAADSLHSETTTGSDYYHRELVTSSAHPPTTAHEGPSPIFSGVCDDHSRKLATAAGSSGHLLGPQSPSSPLAFQNGLQNPLGDPWDQHQQSWSSTRTNSWPGPSRNIFIPHVQEETNPGRPLHTDIYIGPNGTIESTSGGWTPHFYDGMPKSATSGPNTMMMASTTARDQSESSSSAQLHQLQNRFSATVQSSLPRDHCRPAQIQNIQSDDHVWFGKHRLELSVDGDDHQSTLQLKRSKNPVGHHAAVRPSKWGDHQVQPGMLRTLRHYTCPGALGSLQASQAMDVIAIGPALNTNGKPRARRGSATDPQSVYARQRRERINDRLKTLQHLVPNGAKVDIVTMLDEAYDYVKFLEYQVTLLKSDEFWMHATPHNYNGMDISDLHLQSQELGSSTA